MALGHLDELQKAEKYPIRWSLQTGFTVVILSPLYQAVSKPYNVTTGNEIGRYFFFLSGSPQDGRFQDGLEYKYLRQHPRILASHSILQLKYMYVRESWDSYPDGY